MASLPRCLALLEKLPEPPNTDDISLEYYFSKTAIICENHLGLGLSEIRANTKPCIDLPSSNDPSSPSWNFSIYLHYTIRGIVQPFITDPELSINEQLSPQQMKLLVHWTNLATDRFLVPNIDQQLLKNQVIQNLIKCSFGKVLADDERLRFLISSVNMLSQVFQVNELVENDQTPMMVLKYLAGLHSIQFHGQCVTGYLNALFKKIPEQYFRFLLMLKSTTALNQPFHDQLHRDLLQRLQARNGFEIICQVLQPRSVSQLTDESKLKNVAVVAGIVGRAGHSTEFYANIIGQIQRVVFNTSGSAIDEQKLNIAIGCLNKIYKLPSSKSDQRQSIRVVIFAELEQFSAPEDIITGNIIYEHHQLASLFRRLQITFIGVPALTFPSKLLIPYLPLLLQLFNKLPKVDDWRNIITSLVTRCLANRESTEFGDLVDSLLEETYFPNSVQLHPRIVFKQTTCQIGDPTQCTFYNPSEVVITILKASNNNLLIYNIFLHLLGQLDQCLLDTSRQSSDLSASLDEMSLIVSTVFKHRIAVISTLSELINHKPFHGQFNENPSATIECLTKLVRRQCSNHSARNEPIMLVVLSIIRELLEKLNRTADSFGYFVAALKEYRSLSSDPAICNHIDGILRLLGADEAFESPPPQESAFEAARTLCSASEPHLKVYGLVQFTKLVRGGADAEVLAKRHAILAIAIDALRDEDSYVFLNCIRLLVQLVDVLEAEVLEAMVVEYRTDGAEVDFRLKVGEVIVKVTEHLGPFAIRYKDILINCFLLGSVNAHDELRASSLSNLGTICRLLSYQVTNFFEELIHITHTTIANDAYAPARRAAVMVFADLVQGFDKLQDFEEILLPVYRALKYALANETDAQTVVHANIGLDRLSAKVRTFLTTGPPEQREIQVLGVKPDTKAKGRSILHIV